MPFIPPIPLIRRNIIIRKLKKHGALSEQTAATLEEAGVPNPNGFRRLTEKLVKDGLLRKTPQGKYYLCNKTTL